MPRLTSLLLLAAVACGTRSAAPPTARQLYELGSMTPLAWLLGDWRSATGSWHWVAAGEKVYGVAFDPAFRQGFQVMIIEDERAEGQTEGVPWLQVYDGPESRNAVRNHVDRQLVRFAQGMADGTPFEVTLSRGDDGFRIEMRRATPQRTLGPPEVSTFRPYGGEPAPELEQVDRALAVAVSERARAKFSTDGDTWADGFAPDGMYWCERCMGGAPGRAADGDLAPRNSPGKFDWAPIASRRVGELGFTIGHMSYRPRLQLGMWRGTYVAIWGRGDNGRWSILFYTRRSAPAALREPES